MPSSKKKLTPSLEDYEVVGTIGSGSYGTCKRIRRKRDGKMLVWKELNYVAMSETEKQMLVSEVNLLRELKHEHIVRYYDRIIDRSNSTLYIIMEYCEGGDLSSLISTLKREGRHCDEDFVWRVCYQMVLALKECHSRQRTGKAVLHRDLKPANVFLDAEGNIKLGDFGLARVLTHETSFASTFVGTPFYMSPEQMNNSSYNEKSDIWSLGCLLYELCSLRPPFTADSQSELRERINVGHFQRVPAIYSDALNSLIVSLIVVQESRRPTMDEVLQNPALCRHAARTRTPPADSPVTPRAPDTGSGEDGVVARAMAQYRRCQLLDQREQDIEARENVLSVREKQLAEREESCQRDRAEADRILAEAERLKQDYYDLKMATDFKMPDAARIRTTIKSYIRQA